MQDKADYYFQLSQKIQTGTVFIQEYNLRIPINIGSPIACGGSKCAYNLSDETALILPNLSTMPHEKANYWDRMVHEEIRMSQFLTSLNILNPMHEESRVFVSSLKEDMGIPCYTSIKFDEFARRGIYILD